jgi:CRISPR-associated helicase Cas3/CRISPR-associated endonuclease Cas3-HD
MAKCFAPALARGDPAGPMLDNLAAACALLHDYGKATKGFQARLHDQKTRVDHSTAGGQEAIRRYDRAFSRLLAYVILSHHAGLANAGYDEGALDYRLAHPPKEPPDPAALEGLSLPPQNALRYPFPDKPSGAFSISFLIRMLYSALVDADSLNTESFCDPEKAALRQQGPPIAELRDRLDTHLIEKFSACKTTSQTPKEAEILRLRGEILKTCQNARLSPGIYTLTVPTGGGKTFASLALALNHAVQHGMRRVIYAIPFTSIIEQNAAQFAEALGAENVLEHHSNADFGDEEQDEERQQLSKKRLTAENWDAPVVVTTNVQFFESLFAATRSRCRKLHNIAGSVIVLDEAQMLDSDFLKPSLAALSELVRHYHCTVILCTATQPALGAYLPEGMRSQEIMQDPMALYEAFRKVRPAREGVLSLESLAERLAGERQVLCIVNTRGAASELYGLLPKEAGTFHLSARMTAAHRSAKIAEIRARLDLGQPCRVVSTQLVEAGVDLDFPVVYRAEAGLDSIVQAAGRCNRNGRLAEDGELHVFSQQGQVLRGWFDRTARYAREVMDLFPEDPLQPRAIEKYFEMLYGMHAGKLDEKKILESMDFGAGAKNLNFDFKRVAREYQLIEDNTFTVYIPHDEESREIAGRLRKGYTNRRDLRKLGRYGVQVYENELKELLRTRSVEPVTDSDAYLLTDPDLYDDQERGLLHIGENSLRTDFLYM